MEAIKKWVLEGVKVAVRYGTFAFLSALADYGSTTLAGTTLPNEVKWAITLGLAGLDKVVYEWRKEVGYEGKWKGISPV